MSEHRSTKDGPFCWQNKAVRRKIREAFDSTNNVTSALAVYDALTEIASDSQSETFTTTHAWIQRTSGCSVTTIKRHLGVFAELGLVVISTPALRAPSEYTLLSLIAHDGPTIANHGPTLAHGPNFGERATLEQSQNNELKKDEGDGISVRRQKTDRAESPWSLREREKAIREELGLLEAKGKGYRSADQCEPGEYPGAYTLPEYAPKIDAAKARLRDINAQIADITTSERAD